jgi:hypothetical protein
MASGTRSWNSPGRLSPTGLRFPRSVRSQLVPAEGPQGSKVYQLHVAPHLRFGRFLCSGLRGARRPTDTELPRCLPHSLRSGRGLIVRSVDRCSCGRRLFHSGFTTSRGPQKRRSALPCSCTLIYTCAKKRQKCSCRANFFWRGWKPFPGSFSQRLCQPESCGERFASPPNRPERKRQA